MKFTDDELNFLAQASENAVIKGKDAVLVSQLIVKIHKEWQKRQEPSKVEAK